MLWAAGLMKLISALGTHLNQTRARALGVFPMERRRYETISLTLVQASHLERRGKLCQACWRIALFFSPWIGTVYEPAARLQSS